MMGRRKPALVLAAVLVVGCATVQNTPEQERTWAAWEACKAAGRVTHWQIERVDPDGTIRWWASGSPYGLQEIEACMKEGWAKQTKQP
jgi:hypothetical protein